VKVSLAFISLALPIGASAQTSSIDLDLARSYFAEVHHLGDVDNGRLWGKRVDGPMLFVDPQSRQIVANMPDSSHSWREQTVSGFGSLHRNKARPTLRSYGQDETGPW
jgi:hypothetical protein